MKRISIALLAVSLLGLWAVQTAWSAESAKDKPTPKEVTLKGLVTVQKDKDGKITSIKLTHKDKTVYQIVLDTKGTEIGKTLADKHVEVTGTEETKNKETWITVKSIKELTAHKKGDNKTDKKK
jgi:hypothetical protein